MILKFLKNSDWYLIVIFFVFSALLFFSNIFLLDDQNIGENFIFPPLIFLLIYFIIVSFHSIGLNNLIYEKDVIKNSNFILPFVFILLNTPFIISLKMIAFSFSLLFFLNYLLDLYKQKYPFSIVFNASLILSILSIFQFAEILFLFPLIFISMIIFRNIDWRSFIISLIGLLVPYIFLWTYQFMFEINLYFPVFNFSYNSFCFSFIDILIPQKIWFCFLAIIIILSVFELFKWIYKKSIRSRESFNIIIFYIIICIMMFLFSNNKESIYLSLTPISIIITNYFVYSKKSKTSGLIFIFFLFISIFYRISMINL